MVSAGVQKVDDAGGEPNKYLPTLEESVPPLPAHWEDHTDDEGHAFFYCAQDEEIFVDAPWTRRERSG